MSLLQCFWWLPFRQDNSSPVCPVAAVPCNLTPVLLHSSVIPAWSLRNLSLQTLAQVEDRARPLLRHSPLSPYCSLMLVVSRLPSRGRHHSTPKRPPEGSSQGHYNLQLSGQEMLPAWTRTPLSWTGIPIRPPFPLFLSPPDSLPEFPLV